MVYDFIIEICKLLKINVPRISYDASKFLTDTTLAQCNSLGTIIYLRKYNTSVFDQFFAIAHELRHIWQLRNDELLFFQNISRLIYLYSVISELALRQVYMHHNLADEKYINFG